MCIVQIECLIEYLEVPYLVRYDAGDGRAEDCEERQGGVDDPQLLLRDAKGLRLQRQEREHGHGA